MSNRHKIERLVNHRDNLAKATTLEEYKAAHIGYINSLINVFRYDDILQEVVNDAINNFEANIDKK